jgi:hypothetical protein
MLRGNLRSIDEGNVDNRRHNSFSGNDAGTGGEFGTEGENLEVTPLTRTSKGTNKRVNREIFYTEYDHEP